MMARAEDAFTREIAERLLNRKLYKAVDVSAAFLGRGNEAGVAKFRAKLTAAKNSNEFDEFDLFEDTPKRNPYKRRGYDTPEALAKVLIRQPSGDDFEDLSNLSEVVKSLQEKSVYRVYVRNDDVRNKILSILGEVEA